MAFKGFKIEIKDKLAIITYGRPEKKNAFNVDIYVGLTQALNELSAREDVTVTVLTGSGDFYSSGNDLVSAMNSIEEVGFEKAVELACDRVRDFVEAFINHKKVLVAVVNGPAIGIATTTLPLCDVVYCTPNAWFTTPFTRLAICAEGCSSYTFPRILGTSKANEMLLFNGKLTAQEAYTCGLVAKVVPADQMETQVWSVLKKNAAELGPTSLKTSKELMRRFTGTKLHDANITECNELRKLFVSDEAIEAKMKFLTRRSKM